MQYLYPNFNHRMLRLFNDAVTEKERIVEVESDRYEEIGSFEEGCCIAVLEDVEFYDIKNSDTKITTVRVHEFYEDLISFKEVDGYFHIHYNVTSQCIVKKHGEPKFCYLNFNCEKCGEVKRYDGSLEICNECE